MIKSVTVINPRGESLKLELTNPNSSGLIIQSIEGIGPGKADIISSELSTVDGSNVTATRMQQRNILITLLPISEPSIEENRLKTYKYFPLKKKVKLVFETDQRIAECEGYVESNEPDIFSENESIKISIICPDPYFYEKGDDRTAFSGTQPSFEFPFENNSLEEDLIEFGEIRLDTKAILTYTGDMDTGFIITIQARGSCDAITIYNVETLERMVVDVTKIQALTGQPFGAGDVIVISTYNLSKYVRLIRNGISTNVISILEKNPDFFQISSGDNVFAFASKSGEENIMLVFTYRNAYGGI